MAGGGRDDPGGPVEAQVGAGPRHRGLSRPDTELLRDQIWNYYRARGEGVVPRRRPLVAEHGDVGLEM